MQRTNITLKALDALKTITTFDDGSEDGNSIYNNSISTQIIGKASTPISLLVESLVQQLCTLLEQDETRATDLYNVICGKLHQMNLIDETYSMGEFEVMRSQYQKALYQLVTVARGSDLPINIQSSIWPLCQSSGLEWSRYYREFEEIEFIAGGGFGKVFKARHKLDSLEYAIKKVFIKSSIVGNVMVHLSEVKTLASLNHPNIVSYKAAWLEPYLSNNKDNSLPHINKESTYGSYTGTPQDSNITSDSSSSICFEDPDKLAITIDDTESHSNISKSCNKQICMYNNSKLDLNTENFVDLKWATLYIQMSLCQMTLRQWLNLRNHGDLDTFYAQYKFSNKEWISQNTEQFDITKNTQVIKPNKSDLVHISEHIKMVINILKQLAKGLTYIHSRGIVHHDIKPSNIFIGNDNGDINVQLGDFGLACPLKKVHSDTGLGTPLYAAPEQLKGECDIKSDIYSLGIIMLELLQCYNTEMERMKNLTNLRAGNINEDLKKSYPELTRLIAILTKRDPKQRCTTDELLLHLENIYTHNENYEKDKTINILKDKVAELNNIVEDKNAEIENLKIIIRSLSK